MNRTAVAVVAAVIAVVIAVALSSKGTGIPLISVQQGISVLTVSKERVFLVRQGEVLTAFLAASDDLGLRFRWCPREQVFWEPAHGSLYSAEGRYAFGPVSHDMVRLPARVDGDLNVHVDTEHPRTPPRSNGRAQIPREIYEFYQRFLNYNPALPTPTRPVFCPNPLR
jgi:hypothetical protein